MLRRTIYGLAVIGVSHPKDIRRDGDAKPGDALVLTKALASGFILRRSKGGLSPEAYAEIIASMTLLDGLGVDLVKDAGVRNISRKKNFMTGASIRNWARFAQGQSAYRLC